jgi:hypothetical protein
MDKELKEYLEKAELRFGSQFMERSNDFRVPLTRIILLLLTIVILGIIALIHFW